MLTTMILAGVLLTGCTGTQASRPGDLPGELIIFHAGSLTLPVQQLSARFQELHPDVVIASEAAGSRTTARKVSELGREADLVMSADYQVIDALLIPEYASWNVQFARNSMVIAYTDQALYAAEINSVNWYQILTREGVIVGRSDPQADPNGYRTLLVWQLAEKYYNLPGLYQMLAETSPAENVRAKETDLLPLLKTGEMDYAFSYLSIARQHGLKYVELPDEINLSNPAFSDFYQTAQVELEGTEPGDVIIRRGEPIIYGVTIPSSAPHPDLALSYLEFLLSSEGRRIIEEGGQLALDPPLSGQFEALPGSLQELVEAVR